MTAIGPGTVWLDGKPGGVLPDWRRVVQVAKADESFVEGVGWWQQLKAGRWVDSSAPGNTRKTRIRTALFVRRYTQIEALDHPAVRVALEGAPCATK